jgi:hypothetical protein
LEEPMRLWIKGRKRDIISATIGSIVAVVIWVVLIGPTEREWVISSEIPSSV